VKKVIVGQQGNKGSTWSKWETSPTGEKGKTGKKRKITKIREKYENPRKSGKKLILISKKEIRDKLYTPPILILLNVVEY